MVQHLFKPYILCSSQKHQVYVLHWHLLPRSLIDAVDISQTRLISPSSFSLRHGPALESRMETLFIPWQGLGLIWGERRVFALGKLAQMSRRTRHCQLLSSYSFSLEEGCSVFNLWWFTLGKHVFFSFCYTPPGRKRSPSGSFAKEQVKRGDV